jgi:hypothetical protein
VKRDFQTMKVTMMPMSDDDSWPKRKVGQILPILGVVNCCNKNNDIIISLQVFIHMASMIDDKVTWMSKISFENVIRIKSLKI